MDSVQQHPHQLTNALLAAMFSQQNPSEATVPQQLIATSTRQPTQSAQTCSPTLPPPPPTAHSSFYSMPLKKRRSTSPPIDQSTSAKRLCLNSSTISTTSGQVAPPSESISPDTLPTKPLHSSPKVSTSSTTVAPPTTASTTFSTQKRNSCSSDCSQPDSNNNTLDSNQNDLHGDFLDFDSDEDEGLLLDKKGKQGRNMRKMIIEKRRRDRINQSLNELRRLVPAAFEKQGSAKLEKAEILQLTVEHLKQLRAKVKSEPETTKPSSDYHTIGFQECAEEVARFLTMQEKLSLEEQVRMRVLSHLNSLSGNTLSPVSPAANVSPNSTLSTTAATAQRTTASLSKNVTDWTLPIQQWWNAKQSASALINGNHPRPISPASSSSGVSSASASSVGSPSGALSPVSLPSSSAPNSRSGSTSSVLETQVSSTQSATSPQMPLSRVGRAKNVCRQVQRSIANNYKNNKTNSVSRSSTPAPSAHCNHLNTVNHNNNFSTTLPVNSSQPNNRGNIQNVLQQTLPMQQMLHRINPLLLDAQSQLLLAAQQRFAGPNCLPLNGPNAVQSAQSITNSFNQSATASRSPLNLSLTTKLY